MKNPSFQLNIATVSYEGSVFTWNTQLQAPSAPAASQEEEGRVDCPSGELTMTSGFHCCAGSLKSLAISKSGKYLACGGNDERIRIFNMFENKTLGELSTHTGAITALDFFEDSYLISGSEDHTLCIWRVHDWVCVHILGGHKSPITSIAIHPSGKLVLSACRDNVLKVWNLVQGRIAFTRRLKAPPAVDGIVTTTVHYPSCLHWQYPSGNHYLTVTEKRIEVVSASDNSSIGVYDSHYRINQAQFFRFTALSGEAVERICAINEGRHLTILEFDGTEIMTLDLSSQGGRLRDLSISSWNYQSTRHALGTCCTSNGKTLVLNLNTLQNLYSANPQISPESLYEKSVLISDALTVEPRFTCTVSWIRSNQSKKSSTVEATSDTNEKAGNDNSAKESKAEKKRKRKNKEIEDEVERETKVRFQEAVSEPSEPSPQPTKQKNQKKKGKGKAGQTAA